MAAPLPLPPALHLLPGPPSHCRLWGAWPRPCLQGSPGAGPAQGSPEVAEKVSPAEGTAQPCLLLLGGGGATTTPPCQMEGALQPSHSPETPG